MPQTQETEQPRRRGRADFKNNPSYLWWKDSPIDDVTRTLAKCGTNLDYFKQIAYGHRVPGRELALKLEYHTKGKLKAYDLLFGKHLKK